jgi:hypothetical protein
MTVLGFHRRGTLLGVIIAAIVRYSQITIKETVLVVVTLFVQGVEIINIEDNK